ncbi:MAG TPA: site-specific DNA-methyltransferase [Bacilli bacterium]|nr:site-specific DNA-methyltransferase [Bacilli bacterium]HPL55752.1 site-specific DNA-methyltransferase [Bacilli bacterium]
MPTLNWIGKEKIITHHQDVRFRTLKKKYSYGEKSNNIIIHGDNLEGLKSLLPKYEGLVDCVYIDPPYNTGKKEGQWVYSDNVDDPRLLKWLGEVVGNEEDDLSRHDKWLCMMYPRLKLIQKLMTNEAAIFISIDDNELYNLKLICDEIFGSSNFIGQLSVEINPKGRKNSKFISISNDYCLIYAKDKTRCYFLENIPKDKKDLSLDENGNLVHNSGKRVLVGENNFNKVVDNFDSDKHYSIYFHRALNNIVLKKETSIHDSDERLISKGFERFCSFNEDHFVENTYSKDKFIELFNEGALDFKNEKIYEKNFSTMIRMKTMLVNRKYQIYSNGIVINFEIDLKTTSAGTELKAMFKTKKPIFENSKNKTFIELLISLIDKKDALILDCFAGSGTTGHSVLDLNKKDGGTRSFIEIEMMDYADTITASRTKIAIDGYDDVPGLRGGFSFFELGEPILLEDGNLNNEIDESEIRKFIFYSETHKELQETGLDSFLGINDSVAYYMFFNKNQVTCLNVNTLDKISVKADSYVVYADSCSLSKKFLDKNHIVFKKIPRDIRKI